MALVEPGTVVMIGEGDYLNGHGDLRMHLITVGDGRPVHESAEWVRVAGRRVTPSGQPEGETFAVMVRTTALLKRPPSDGPAISRRQINVPDDCRRT